MTNTQTRDDAGKYAEKRKIGKAEKLAKRLWLMTGVVMVAIVLLGIGQASSLKVTNEVEAETKVVEVYHRAPVQDRIAGCESVGDRNSKGKQFDSKGRLYKHVNTNGSIDVGKNGINITVWELKAVELGFNIYTEEGNDKMADWIYQNRGTQDWYSSEACWK